MKLKPILVGLITAALGAVLFALFVHRYQVQVSGGDRVEVLVAVKRVDRGTALNDDLLTTQSIPQAYLDERMVRASDRGKILGLKAAEPIDVSQTVLWSDVVRTRDDKRDLSTLVQPGYRAMTAPFEASPTFEMIRPGDFVDVIAVVERQPNGPRDSIVILQRALVLATGNTTATEQAAQKGLLQQPPALTLSLNTQEAQLLALAAKRGSLAVALRNPHDQRVSDNPPELSGNALFEADARAQIANQRRRGRAGAPTKLEVEKP
jgi:pilus assembly protein CpaB